MCGTRAGNIGTKLLGAQHAAPTVQLLLNIGRGPLLVVMTLSAVLSMLFLDAKSLDLDEAFSMAITGQDWETFFQTMTAQANMSLYYGLLRLWRILGEDEAIVRTLSVLPAVASVPVLYALGARLFDKRTGLISALLLSLNAYHVKYAQEARSYSLLVLLVTLSWFFFVGGIKGQSRRSWVGYIATSILAGYTHFFSLFVLAAQFVSLVFLRPRQVPIRALLLSFTLIGALLFPLGLFALRAGGLWAWIPRPSLGSIPGVYYVLAGGSGRLAHPSAIGVALMLAYFALAAIAVGEGAQALTRLKSPVDTWRYGLLLTWLILPVVLAFGVSMVKSIFGASYLIVCLPPLVILAAVGLSSIPRKYMFISTLALIVVLASHETYAYYSDFQKEDFRGATYRVLSLADSGDGILFHAPYGRDGFDYYRKKVKGAARLVVLPNWNELGASPRYGRVWLLQNSNYDIREIQAALSRQYTLEQEWSFPGLHLFKYHQLSFSWSNGSPLANRAAEGVRVRP